MKMTVEQRDLNEALDTVRAAVSSRSTLPILSNVLLVTVMTPEGWRLQVAATNLEQGISMLIPAIVELDGSTTVPARLFGDLVKSLPPGPLSLEYQAKPKTLLVQATGNEARVKCIDAEDYPTIPDMPEDALDLPAATLAQLIEAVAFAASVEPSRPVLTGVETRLAEGKLTLAATDGFRLAVGATNGLPDTAPLFGIVPAAALAVVQKLVKDAETARFALVRPAGRVFLRAGPTTLVAQLIDGNYPDYHQIMPKSAATSVIVAVEDLARVVRRAGVFARDGANIVRLTVEPGAAGELGRVQVRALSTEYGDVESVVDAAVEGNGLEIGFNAKYLLDALTHLPKRSTNARLEFGTPASPMKLTPNEGDGFVQVIMPMHIGR